MADGSTPRDNVIQFPPRGAFGGFLTARAEMQAMIAELRPQVEAEMAKFAPLTRQQNASRRDWLAAAKAAAAAELARRDAAPPLPPSPTPRYRASARQVRALLRACRLRTR